MICLLVRPDCDSTPPGGCKGSYVTLSVSVRCVGSLSSVQLNGSGSKGGHKEDDSRSQSTDGGSECWEDGPAKKR